MENKKESTACPGCGTAQPGQPSALSTFSFTIPTLVKEATEEPVQTDCPGCIGCDSDSFDFSQLDSRQLPVYPEQSLTPEEYSRQVVIEKPSPTQGFVLTNFPMSMSSPLSFNYVSSLAQQQRQASPGGSPIAVVAQNQSPFGIVGTEAEESYEQDDDDEYEDDEDEAPMFEALATLSVRYPGNPGELAELRLKL